MLNSSQLCSFNRGPQMNFLTNRIKWLMIVSGVFTCSMLIAFLSPETAINSFFGETSMSPGDQVVVRNWGFLIFGVGALLIYGAFNHANRNLTLMIAIISKVVFVGLVLSQGALFLDTLAVPVIVDSIIIVLFILYLLLERNQKTRSTAK